MKKHIKNNRRTIYFLSTLLLLCICLPIGTTIAKYTTSDTIGDFQLTIVKKEVLTVSDIFYNGSGFYADPDCTMGIKIIEDNSLDFTGTSDTELTELYQLEGTTSYTDKRENYSVWMQTQYTITDKDVQHGLSGAYIIRRYTGNTGNVLLLNGKTLELRSIVDGNRTAATATYVGIYTDEETEITSTKMFVDQTIARVIASGGSGASALVKVTGSATLTLLDDGSIRNNYASAGSSNPYGSGVYVESSTLNINGGSIEGNYISGSGNDGSTFTTAGAGVYLNGGTINMTAGTVKNNTVSCGCGGGIAIGKGTVTMSGGTISGNTVSSNAAYGNSYTVGGGVAVRGSSAVFTMNDGVISGNGGNGVNVGGGVGVTNYGTFNLNGGTIMDNISAGTRSYAGVGGGIGISYYGKVYMSAGTLTGNSAYTSGGGVGFHYNSSGTFKMTGGTITENTAQCASTTFSNYTGGGGIFYRTSKHTCTISGDSVVDGNLPGEGVDICASSSTGSHTFSQYPTSQ